jgi:PAS domain S-box-containing protein
MGTDEQMLRECAQDTATMPNPQTTLPELAFEQAPLGMAVLDAAGTLRQANPAWAHFIARVVPERPPRLAPGSTLAEMVPPLAPAAPGLLAHALAGDTVYHTLLSPNSSDTICWEISASPLGDPDAISSILITSSERNAAGFATTPEHLGVLSAVRASALHSMNQTLQAEIAERQRAEEDLRESQRTLATLLSNLPGMAYRCHDDNRWTMEFVSQGAAALTGYAPDDLTNNQRTAYAELIHPDDRDAVQREVRDAIREQRPFQITYRITTASGDQKWVWEQGHGVEARTVSGLCIEGFVTDITERVQAQHFLEERIEHRTHQLRTLLDVSRHVASTLDMQTLLGVVLDQLKLVLDYTGAAVFALEGDDLQILAYRGPIEPDEAARIRFSLDRAGANREVVRRREPVIIGDILDDTPLARLFREAAGDELQSTFRYIRAWMGVPLIFKEQIVGMLTLDHRTANAYTAERAQLALAFAQQAASAIENARLYDETRRRADETQALLSVQQALTSRLDPDAVLQMIADEARRLTGADFGTVFLREGDDLRVSVLTGHYDHDMTIGYRMPVHESATGLAMLSGQIVRIDEPDDPRVYQDAMRRAGIRNLLGTPLLSNDKPLGVISVGNQAGRQFGAADEHVLALLAPGAVIALENAQLYHAEQERRREADQRRRIAEGLRDILTALNSHRSLDEILNLIVRQARDLLSADAVAIYQLNDEHVLTVRASLGLSEDYTRRMFVAMGAGAVGRAALYRQPVGISDTSEFFATEIEKYRHEIPDDLIEMVEQMTQTYCALLAVPLLIKDDSYGTIALYYHDVRELNSEEVDIVVAFADQAALAIENARLSEQIQQTAALEERQRLARELHDAVTQTLFSASVIADVLPRLWERRPEEGTRRLEELRQLTRGALAEMRTLLLELRPTALLEARLADVLRQLGEAFTGRARLPIDVRAEGDTTLPPDVQVGFYRITQEALNNIVKHAAASQVILELQATPQQVRLCVYDNGRGFDPAQVPAGRLGLGIMHERAAAIGSSLSVESAPGEGTRITVTWRPPHAPADTTDQPD